jgi:hypothetical protein
LCHITMLLREKSDAGSSAPLLHYKTIVAQCSAALRFFVLCHITILLNGKSWVLDWIAKKSMYIYTKLGENGDGHKKHTRKRVCFLCAREELNLHVLTDTSTSTMPVYQFQHSRAFCVSRSIIRIFCTFANFLCSAGTLSS